MDDTVAGETAMVEEVDEVNDVVVRMMGSVACCGTVCWGKQNEFECLFANHPAMIGEESPFPLCCLAVTVTTV